MTDASGVTDPTHPTHVADAASVDPELAGKRLLILGGGLWQRDYVRRARQLGLETWVTDWSASAVARGDADHFEPIDLKDREATLALAERAHVDGVLTAADIGVPTAAYVAERLGLPSHSTELADLATNKFLMRERSRQIGIAGPWYQLVRSADEALEAVPAASLPVIVKPVDNCSSRGVRWIDHVRDLGPAVAEALAASRRSEALVEESLVGTEGSIEAIVSDGRAIVLGFCDKTKSTLPDRFDLELRYPGAFDEPVRAEIEQLAQRIATGFGVRDGILHIEFLVPSGASDGARSVALIEFAIRGCGSKVVTHLIPAMTGVDVVRIVIRQALGLRTPVEPPAGREARVLHVPHVLHVLHGALHFLMFPPGRVTAVHGVDAALAVRGVIDACVERAPGDVIEEVHDGRSRPGHVLVCGRDASDVQRVLAEVRALIRLDYEHATNVAPLQNPEPRTQNPEP